MEPTFIFMDKYKPFVFSVPPKDLRIEAEQKTVSVNLIQFGEMVNLGEKQCNRISFSSFFPNINSPFYKPLKNAMLPFMCVQTLERLKNNKSKIQFIVPEFAINKICKITKFVHVYDERTGDVNFEITLIEHREPNDIIESLGLRLR